MTQRLLAGASLAAVLMLSSSAFAAMDNKEFMTKAIQTNLAEVSLGNLAREKSKDEKVRQYGEKMVKEHTEANAEAVALAKTLSMAPPTEPAEEDQKAAQDLAAMTGKEFDAEFADTMVDGHEKAISMFENQAEGTDDVAQFAKKMLPHLQEHLKMAEALESETSATNDAVKDPSKTAGNLMPGANSFTEGQARSRIADMGYADVKDLKKGEDGIWRGKAMKDGKTVSIGLDYQGNVAAQ